MDNFIGDDMKFFSFLLFAFVLSGCTDKKVVEKVVIEDGDQKVEFTVTEEDLKKSKEHQEKLNKRSDLRDGW